MTHIAFPFQPKIVEEGSSKDPFSSPFFKSLPPDLQEASREHPHLLQYLNMLPVGDIGIPQYMTKLTRDAGKLKSKNLIYPAREGIFVHVLDDPDKVRDWYIGIEPDLDHPEIRAILSEVEESLLDFTDEFDAAKTDEDLVRVLRMSIDRIFGVSSSSEDDSGETTNNAGSGGIPFLSRLFKRGKSGGKGNLNVKWALTDEDLKGLKYSLVKEKVGIGILQPLIFDEYIEDISCSGLGSFFIEHKIFKSLRCSFGFKENDELDDYVLRLSERAKKPVTFRQPVVDASLPDGSRINFVYGRDVSVRGSNFSIRKFAEEAISIIQLVKWGSLNWMMAAYMSLIIEDGMNVFISGETASGKTTLLNALTTFIEPNAKIVSIEDTAEVNVPHANWIQEITRKPKPGESGSGVDMFDLLKAALRQRPDEIIIGEIRGEEGLIAFQAMQTGHAVMATFHASSVQKLIQRLTGSPISVPKNYIDNLNVAVIQVAVRLPNGDLGRRAVSINEIVSYDSKEDAFSFVEVFRWDPATDTFEFTGDQNSYLLEYRIAASRGYPPARRRQIYSLVQRRARILEKLAESGLIDYGEVYKVLAKANREGLF